MQIETIFWYKIWAQHLMMHIWYYADVSFETGDRNKPAIKCDPSKPYRSCFPPSKARPAPPCSLYTRNCWPAIKYSFTYYVCHLTLGVLNHGAIISMFVLEFRVLWLNKECFSSFLLNKGSASRPTNK